jgi:peptide alpha-N-acetyltransferase
MTDIEYISYTDESMLKDVQKLVSKDLSEPYSVFTYRYFLHNWPFLCICAYITENDTTTSSDDMNAISNHDIKTNKKLIGTIVCKLEGGEENNQSGYIAMLAVDVNYRKQGIGMKLVNAGIENMISMGCREVILETEVYVCMYVCMYVCHRRSATSICTVMAITKARCVF